MNISTYGRAVTGVIDPASENAHIPTICIGKQDVAFLKDAVANRSTARVHFKAEFIDDARTSNIVGTLPGETDEEILIFAHADT